MRLAHELSRRFRLPGIAGRVFLFTAAIVCAVLVAALVIASRTGRRSVLDAERHSLEQAADLAAQLLAGRARTLAGGARVFVQGPYFRALVAERRRDDITDQAFEANDQLAADWVFITDERGVLLAKSDEPGAQGVSMADIPLVAGALEGRTMSGYGVSRDSLLFQAVAIPIVVPGAAPVGVLVATKLVDSSIVRVIRQATGAEVVFYALDSHGAPQVAATSLARRDVARAALPQGDSARPSNRASVGTREAARTALIGDASFALQGGALTTAGGDIIGGYVVGRPQESTPTQIAGVRRSLLFAGLLGLALALAAAWSAARHVTRPARDLAQAAGRALEGDYDTAARIAAAANRPGAPPTEIAVLGSALASLLEELREKQALIAVLDRAVASGAALAPSQGSLDHEARVPPRSRQGGRGRAMTSAVAQSLPTPMTATGVTPALGTLVAARYRLEEAIGAGGTGVVYRATDLTLHETVALKMLRPDLLAADSRAQEELKHELRLARRVSHRNVVRTHDFGTSDGVAFITMEFVEGTPLSTVLTQRGALSPAVVTALAKQLLRALESAHEQGVVHGDLKPANLLVAPDGLLKVTDFGVATLVRKPHIPGDERVSPPHLAGAVVGTPEYMAPELLLGESPDARSDLYAAGIVLYECLTGATPFQRDTPRGFLSQKLDSGPRAVPTRFAALTGAGESLDGLIAWMTSADPADRPGSASAVAAVLARLAT
jgi:serine/threonine-protein kinase